MSENPFAPPSTDQSPSQVPKSGKAYRYRPLKIPLRILQICIGLYIMAVLGTMICQTIGQANYPSFSEPEADLTDHVEQALIIGMTASAGVQVLMFLCAAIFVCVFMHRANGNAHLFSSRTLEFTPGWCVGFWFIPIINLFRPYQAMKEILQVSCDATGNRRDDVGTMAILGPWWGCWLVGGWISRVTNRMELRGVDLGSMGLVMELIAAVLLIAAATGLVLITKKIAELQTQVFEDAHSA